MATHDADPRNVDSDDVEKSSRAPSSSRPLIDSARNEWQSHSHSHIAHPPSSNDAHNTPQGMQMIQSLASAPRFRRYVIIYPAILFLGLLGWWIAVTPRLQEQRSLLFSLDPASKDKFGGWFGTNSPPRFDYLIQIRNLDQALVPLALPEGDKDQSQRRRRLIVIGDVHGCKDELLQLLKKVSFAPADGDHLIFAGDLISKGPDSPGVVDLARKHSASCVRGNHEDRSLLLRHQLVASNTLDKEDADDGSFTAKEQRERALARSLNEEQARWLETCPVILDVGSIPGMGHVVVAHAGLVPGVELEKQDPATVMNMRVIDLDTHVPSWDGKGVKWVKIFNKHQSLIASKNKASSDNVSQTMTVIYGHDADSSLSIRPYTKGLDSGCVKGGKLTAMIIEDGGKQNIVQVKCRDYRKEK
ncbi:hypothetical protein NUU61_002269 [Penicillium alfredii]|uniref:Calcineurin-like phosphoesterase domain-containing protein n=1 Tax=Penicillium alfredii TaxID=1506179 RepID=A0A9W9FRD1_9EURO|nr:uncharacterized protein NUU61_002269 [Penicillium alfredii]KAJ5104922.1 hypothetical protein NUU61_002269 [Penicillium alfredii]